MSAQQNLVGAAAIGLVVANVWNGGQRPALAAVVSGSGPTDGTHTAVKQVGIELLGAGVLTLVSGSSTRAGNIGLLIVTCLWILWFVHRPGTGVGTGAGAAARIGSQIPGLSKYGTGPAVGTGPAPSGGGVPYTQQIPGLPPIPGHPYPTN